MRTCQFCGSPVEPVDPTAQEVRQNERATGSAIEATDQAGTSSIAAGQPNAAAAAEPAEKPTSAKDDATSSTAKKFLIYYIGPVVGGGLAIFLALRIVGYFAARGEQGLSANPGTAQSQGAAPSPGNASESQLGVDVYPGADVLSGADRSTSGDNVVVSASFSTHDPTAQVIDFYKSRMRGFASIYADTGGVVVSSQPSPQESIRVAITQVQSDGTTRIYITHTTAKTSN